MAKSSKPKATSTPVSVSSVASVPEVAKVTKGKTAATATTAAAAAALPVSAPVLQQVVASAATVVAAEKPAKKTRAKAAPKEKEVQEDSNVVLSQTVKSEDDVADVPDQTVLEQSNEFVAKLQQLGLMISALKTEYKALERKWTKELKTSSKNGKKRKRSGNRAPSGFVKPTRISNELAGFLEKPEGTEMARTSVTRDINTYIRSNNLQDKSNGRKINPDVKLATLLKLAPEDELTYFNLQKYMSIHFAKTVKPEAAPVAPIAGVTF
jgi:chromatin remodeling complex protein RSC6